MKKSAFVLAGLAALIVASLLFSAHRPKAGQRAPAPASAAPGLPSGNLAAASARSGSNAPPARPAATGEFDLAANPYAAALRASGKSKRAWDLEFLKAFQKAAAGDPIRFELTDGRMAAGTIRITQYREGQLTYLSGELTEPERGKFFFLTPPAGGKAGKAVGVVEFPDSQTAYRIEPTGPNGDPELWQRRLDEVLCLSMPRPQTESAAASTHQVAEAPPLRPDLVAEYVPSYNSNIVSLQSYPGSPAVLLLDFFGGYTPTWGGIAYAKPAGVNNTTIRDLWKRVAEDYLPFNINVTTDIGVYLAAPASSRQRCCFTDTPVTAAGVAYIGSWNWGSDTPCWSVYNTGKNGAEVGAHEPGHTLGLGHQGQITSTSTNEYYRGQGSGATGWAPIMGVGYYQPVATWAKGEYTGANNFQDELSVIDTANNNVAYRPDDTGNTLATARYLEVDANGNAYAEGVIERTGDTDAFQFTTTGGLVTLAANPVREWANLAMMVTLADATGTVLLSNNPQSQLWGTVSTNLPAGTYTFRVTGAGRNNPLSDGFSSYASLGYYSVAGSVAGARLPTRLSVLEHAANTTGVGTVPAGSPTDPLAYALQAGNTGGTFAIDNTGLLTVANNTLLDYNRLATNTLLAVQFELFVNITNLANPARTELNRRVVVSVLRSGGNYPVAVSGFNASIIAPCTATPTMPKATAFDIPNNYCLYQAGLNANVQAAGTYGGRGLPASGLVMSAVDNATFQLGPCGAPNALMLGYTYAKTATLTLATPRAYSSLALLAASANGGGNGTLVLNFANGTRQSFAFNAQDWYGTTTNVALQGYGRLKLGQSTLVTEDPGWNNPNFYQTTLNLAALGLNQPLASITFTGPSAGSTTTTAILGLSGSVMPAQPSIAQQPQSTTNNVPSQAAVFSVAAMGTPPLAYQWYSSATGFPGSYAPLAGQTGSSLVLGPTLQTTEAGNFYVVVTNNAGAVTSTVASLTVARAPYITQQPSPASLSLMAGQSASLSVSANAALPVSYYWLTNGAFRSGGTAAFLNLANLQVADAAHYSVLISNAYGAVTSTVVALTVLPVSYPVAQLVLNDRALGYWRLDETGGTVAHDYAGGRNGLYNKVLLGQPGYRLVDAHRSARFGYLAANTSLVTNIPVDFATAANLNANFSVEAWVNGGPQSSDAGLVTKGYGGGGEQFNLDCGGGGHAFRFFVRDISGAAHVAASSVKPDNQWHHLVGVCDQFHTNVVLYVDGTNAAQTTIVAGSGLLSATNLMSIGCRRSGATSGYDLQFAGYIEEVAVYGYALSASQVQAHYSAASNRAPVFAASPFTMPGVTAGQFYGGSVSGAATDPNGDPVTYTKSSGPAWLNLAGSGALSGTPLSADVGPNAFVVRAVDPSGLFSTATMNLTVLPAAPILASFSGLPDNLVLAWSGGIAPYQVQMTTNLANPFWQPAAGPLTETNLPVQPTNPAAFYRVVGQ